MFCSVDVFSANNRNYYVEKHIQYQLEDEEHNGYDLFDLICARYSDDKTPVALSGYHDGKLFATVPIESVDREIEVFLAYDIKFNDDLGYSADNQMFDMFEALYMRDILMPDKNGCVYPNAYITRGKVCNELVKFSGFIQNTTLVIPYKDVPVEHMYYDDISTLYNLNIVQGTGNGFFEPDRFITREELTVLVARIAGVLINNSKKTKQSETADLLPSNTQFNRYYFNERNFMDSEKISEWARESYTLMGPGAIFDEDYNGFYNNPQKCATKRDFARLLFALLEINLETYKN